MKGILLSGAVSAIFAFFATPALIRFLTKRSYGQIIRDDGPTTHQVKRGTPTMGGIVLISATLSGYFISHLVTGVTPTTSALLVIGLILGLALAVLLGIAIYRGSLKINLGKFFTITGIALIVIAGGVLSYAIHEFQEFGALPGEEAYVWNWVNADPTITTLLSGTIGISTKISWLQLIVWAIYLTTVLQAYLKPKKVALVNS